MKRKLYGNKIEPACEYCAKGRASSDGMSILCERRGVMPLYYSCYKFKYDPLRRKPYRSPAMKTYSDDEFRIE